MFTGQFTDHERSLPDPDPRQSWILDFTLWIPDSRNWIPDPMSVEIGFRNPIVSGILNSLRSIPESKVGDLGFHKETFQGFRNPDYLTRWEMVDENRWRQKRGSSLIEVGWFRHVLSAQLVNTKISQLKLQSCVNANSIKYSVSWISLIDCR